MAKCAGHVRTLPAGQIPALRTSRREIVPNDTSYFFQEYPVGSTESRGSVTVDVQFLDDSPVRENRNDDLGTGFNRAGEISVVWRVGRL
jgi:hypothetical protein